MADKSGKKSGGGDKKSQMEKVFQLDDEAHKLCKPYGCKVQGCLSRGGMQDCAPLMAALNSCIHRTKI